VRMELTSIVCTVQGIFLKTMSMTQRSAMDRRCLFTRCDVTGTSTYWHLFDVATEGKVKGKDRPVTGHEVPEVEYRYSSTLSLTSVLDSVGGQSHAPAPITPGKTRCPLYRRLGGPKGRSGQVRKISPPTGIRSPDPPGRSESLYRLSYPGHRACYQKLYFVILVIKTFCFWPFWIAFLPWMSAICSTP
jgi:hypothetical protein